ncbi:MAG TPA: hypothetical protein VK034_21625, partial [Enhygromyxa sp.]|nr:hypothetical protein [Enhygromyxa sp.]
SSRRQFIGKLGGLAALSLAGCKIEPILDLPPSPVTMPLWFPDLPPQIPDQLQDAETTLRATTDALLDREMPLLTSGELRERPSEDRKAITHLLVLLRSFGLEPAGNRGGWVLPVPVDIVEPTGAAPRVTLRPESEAPSPLGQPQPLPDDSGEPAVKRRALELAELGAFRQRGLAAPHQGLLVAPVRDYQVPLTSDGYAGRVALVRPPKDLDLTQPDAPARVDQLLSSIRDVGALGCLLLTNSEAETIQRFRELWQRQVRRPGHRAEAMLIEGVLGAEGRAAIERARVRDESWALDLNLATRQYGFESQNILGRITGRERPDEAVVLTCSWDTYDPGAIETHTLRLLATLGAFAQLAEWSRRSSPPRSSMILLLSADAGFAAGQAVHAHWASEFGTKTTALLALDRPTVEPLPAVSLSGHFDAGAAELARSVVAADGRDLLLTEQLAMPSLAPYLRYPAPVLEIGAPDPAALEDPSYVGESEPAPDLDPRAGLHADIRLLRNLMLALAARR